MSDMLVFNGINGLTGDYLLSPMDTGLFARGAMAEKVPAAEMADMALRIAQDFAYPLKEGVDPDNLSRSGWAVIFPFAEKGSDADHHQRAIRAALQPLFEHRRAQSTIHNEHYYRECMGSNAYRPGETKQQFLARLGAGASGPVDPDKFPYYILLVGSPEEIPYRFQYQLDVQYAVGRIHFDEVDEYAYYAGNVVEAETGAGKHDLEAAFFGVANPDDMATMTSARNLVAPLAEYARREGGDMGWQVREYVAERAHKNQLAALLGRDTPALLFTASHGIGFPEGSKLQRRHQGAILCQDWPGPRAGRVSIDHYFAGEDISGDADLRGLIAFHFACFGAGTPRHDDFVRRTLGTVKAATIAPHAFLARLPQRMLGRARGALACIGHVDRAWGSSFLQVAPGHARRGVVSQLATFESTLKSLMKGHRVGHSMDYFDIRYAELTSDLALYIEDAQVYGTAVNDSELASLWLNAGDARNYAVIGDPAVRLASAPAAARSAPAHEDSVRAPAASVTPPEQDDGLAGDDVKGFAPDLDRGRRPENLDGALHLGDALGRVIADALCFEVQTFANDHAGARAAKAGAHGGTAPGAYTRCSDRGEMVNNAPLRENGELNEELWRIHKDMVASVQRHRMELFRAVLTAIAGSDS